MPARTLAHARQRPVERTREPEPIGRLSDQRGAGMRDQTRSVRPDLYVHIAPNALHPQGDLLNRDLDLRQAEESPLSRTTSRPGTPGARPVNARPGLRRPECDAGRVGGTMYP